MGNKRATGPDTRRAAATGREERETEGGDHGPRIGLDRKGRVRVKLACRPTKASGRCKGVLRLRTQTKVAARRGKPGRRLTLAKRSFSIPAGKARAVTSKLSRKGARLVRTQRKARRVVAMAKLPGQKVVRKSLKLRSASARRSAATLRRRNALCRNRRGDPRMPLFP